MCARGYLFVITTATLLSPFLEDTDSVSSSSSSSPTFVNNHDQMHDGRREKRNFSVFDNISNLSLLEGTTIEVLLEHEKHNHSHTGNDGWIETELIDIVEIEELSSSIKEITSEGSWEVGWKRDKGELPGSMYDFSKLSNELWRGLGFVAFLKLKIDSSRQSYILNRFKSIGLQLPPPYLASKSISAGLKVWIVGSPFGISSSAPKLFLNQLYARKIANKVVGHAGRKRNLQITTKESSSQVAPLLVLDGPVLPGAEGGPLFSMDGIFVGLLLPPIRLISCPRLELPLVLTAEAISSSLQSLPSDKPVSQFCNWWYSSNVSHPPQLLTKSLEAVVLLSVGGKWGSGFLITNNGFIVTCRHLFKGTGYLNLIEVARNNKDSSMDTKFSSFPPLKIFFKGRWRVGEVVWLASEKGMDTALVKMDASIVKNTFVPEWRGVDESDTVMIGEEVFACGHGLFGPTTPSLSTTSGVVSNIICDSAGMKKIIQTSSFVSSGSSGGAIMDTRFVWCKEKNKKPIL